MNVQNYELSNPVNEIKNIKITHYQISRIEVNLGTSATVYILLYGENNEYIRHQMINLTSEEYSQWGTDDNYLLNLINNKIVNN